MDVNGDLDLQGNMLKNFAFEEIHAWPEQPRVGTFIFKDKRLYVCVNLATAVPVWLPISSELYTHIHNQNFTADEWEIEHELSTTTCIVQVSDANGFAIEPDSIEFLYNKCIIRFYEPQVGRAILVHGSTEGIPRAPIAWQQTFDNSELWVVTHNLGYIPVVRAFSGQMEVQPLVVLHSDDMKTTTLTFSSPITGRVRCV